MRYFVLLFAPLILGGCVAAAAGAGAAAGSSIAEDEDVEDVEYWLKTNDATTRIGTAMKSRDIVKGMDRTHVKLVMPAKNDTYDTLPTTREPLKGDKTLWVYEPALDNYPTYRITFEGDKVSSVETVETDDDDGIEGPRGSSGGA